MEQASVESYLETLILSLETATRSGSLALTRGDELLASSVGVADESHSVNLLQQMDALLQGAHLSLRDIDLFAAANGPGSFTGLRIGLATIKAFAATFKRPCVGVPTLEAIAYAAGASACTCALLPAGRGEVFAQLFAVSAEGKVTQLSEAEHVPPHILLERMSKLRRLCWTGTGALVYADAIKEKARELGITVAESREAFSISPEEENLWRIALIEQPLALSVAALALQQARVGALYGAEDLHALYVRPSDAELKK